MIHPRGPLHVVVVNYKTADMTADAVHSVLSSDVADRARYLWIVDNGSYDGSATVLRDRFPDLRLIESPRNLGFAEDSGARPHSGAWRQLRAAAE
jgi:GT2 family glycosyltransferase